MSTEHSSSKTPAIISTDSLIFPEASQNWARTLTSLKRSTLSIPNRLASIHQDSLFVQRVADAFHLPLIANERCGSWYIPPGRKGESAYFKSTDGHQGQWSFSTRRLNLQVLDVIGKSNGCIIVDSTRRGKSMPDALSKTVPIWCAVINRLAFPQDPAVGELLTPSQVVGRSEHVQIEAQLDNFVKDVDALKLDIPTICSKIRKPLRPFWITQDSSLPLSGDVFEDYLPVICCTASRRVPGAERSEGGYIQGAGDDSEGWSCGLTPAVFWRYQQQLMGAAEEDLTGLIEGLLTADTTTAGEVETVLLEPTRQVYIGTSNMVNGTCPGDYDGVVVCGDTMAELPAEDPDAKKKLLRLRCGAGKLGSRALRGELPRLLNFIHQISQGVEAPRLLFACPTGKDLSAGVALAALCLYFDDNGNLITRHHPPLYNNDSWVLGHFTLQQGLHKIDKLYIRRRLSWIMTSHPSANPSRATLQAVNSFLMQKP
ncbi:Initiator tRNA phosphoribosyl transferase [Lasallia pustulata]|uniref:Initiator tRNA phosphoribosyl transferase n=1 Tax=Lasallia pustulata TaxID=136370 RepID=A0A1W5D9D5_9LECA|nr:Initiator tRNA phosphoribosyl transferase [Lasallia pustulata]